MTGVGIAVELRSGETFCEQSERTTHDRMKCRGLQDLEVTGVGIEPTTYGLKVRCSAS